MKKMLAALTPETAQAAEEEQRAARQAASAAPQWDDWAMYSSMHETVNCRKRRRMSITVTSEGMPTPSVQHFTVPENGCTQISLWMGAESTASSSGTPPPGAGALGYEQWPPGILRAQQGPVAVMDETQSQDTAVLPGGVEQTTAQTLAWSDKLEDGGEQMRANEGDGHGKGDE